MKDKRLLLGIGRGSQDQTSLWISRVAPRWLKEVPASVPDSDAKLYFTRLAATILGFFMHASMAAFFVLLDAPVSMALVNVVSCLWFVVAAGIVRSGRHYLGIVVAFVEPAVHVPVATYLIGIEAGYLLFNLVVAMCGALAFRPRERIERGALNFFLLAQSGLLAFLMHYTTPMLALDPMKTRALFWLIAFGTYVALSKFATYVTHVAASAEEGLAAELRRSESLLLNVLPREVVGRLKDNPMAIADEFPEVTVMFADICGFTKLSHGTSGAALVGMLNEVFSEFDRIAARYGLEKIKTIGDAYMVVGGLPSPLPDHAVRVVAMALEMRDAMEHMKTPAGDPLALRIGIHTGPVVAGVIGERKFAYDIWGDTVNTASRMESHGIPGSIQLSEATAGALGDRFALTPRGLVDLKGLGQMRTFIVEGRAVRTDTRPKEEVAAA